MYVYLPDTLYFTLDGIPIKMTDTSPTILLYVLVQNVGSILVQKLHICNHHDKSNLLQSHEYMKLRIKYEYLLHTKSQAKSIGKDQF